METFVIYYEDYEHGYRNTEFVCSVKDEESAIRACEILTKATKFSNENSVKLRKALEKYRRESMSADTSKNTRQEEFIKYKNFEHDFIKNLVIPEEFEKFSLYVSVSEHFCAHNRSYNYAILPAIEV